MALGCFVVIWGFFGGFFGLFLGVCLLVLFLGFFKSELNVANI